MVCSSPGVTISIVGEGLAWAKTGVADRMVNAIDVAKNLENFIDQKYRRHSMSKPQEGVNSDLFLPGNR